MSAFMPAAEKFVLCLDFGGTKLAAGVLELCSHRLLDARQIKTRAAAGAEAVYGDMIKLAESLQGVEKIEAVGVCYGGYARNNNVLLSIHTRGWHDFPLRERLSAHFGVAQVQVANDANAVALSEFRFGAGRGVHSMLFVTVSTGIGGGIIIDGRVHEGAEGISGEIGHVIVEPNGSQCSCGHRGCLEAIAAGPAIAASTRVYLESHPEIPSALRSAEAITAQTIARLAEDGDEVSVEQMRRAARYLGLAVGNAVNLLDVERVIIGGGVSRSGKVWWDEVRATVDSIVLPWHSHVDVLPSALGTHEGIWGAAALLENT
jgi:glucokinase